MKASEEVVGEGGVSASRVRKLGFDHSFYFWGEEPVALCWLITSHMVKWELEER